jgi:hypothetical protein
VLVFCGVKPAPQLERTHHLAQVAVAPAVDPEVLRGVEK